WLGAAQLVGRGGVGHGRAVLGRISCSPLARFFVCECHSISTVPRFQSPPRRTQRADLASRPVESHHRPLIDPSVRLSPHWAPIRRTSRVCRSSSVRTTPDVLEIVVRERDRLWPCDP